MDKNAIKKFAVWARRELISRVSQRAAYFEITEAGFGDPAADSVLGRVLSAEEKTQRQALISQIRQKDYRQVMEEVAYTWFNRFIALRFMEVNGYLPSHVRVFTDEANQFKPQILAEAIHMELDGLDMQKVYAFKNANDDDGLFKYMVIVQCNALSSILPGMFQRISDYTELLFPDNLLREGSVLQQMIELIPEEDWRDAVQIIGWLYQYYNAEKKDEVFAALKKNVKITKENIPAATQLFTPDWIVRYMVENSLGRLWVEGHPNDELKATWKYYLEEAEQEPEVQEQLAEIRKGYAAMTPEQIKCIDPCCGSGHILVYLFDVLVQIYESYGYTTRETVASIVQNNLYGLDIDDRAAQLAYFAVMMKARQYDRRFFSRDIQPHVYAIQNSAPLSHEVWGFLGEEEEIARRLWESFADAKEYGSLVQPNVTLEELERLKKRVVEVDRMGSYGNLFTDAMSFEVLRTFEPLIELAQAMVQKYDVVVTNPPYMAMSNGSRKLNAFIKKYYPVAKADLFSTFIYKGCTMLRNWGYNSMVTMQSWMYLSSFEELRVNILRNHTISNLMNMDNMVMGIAFGTAVSIIQNKYVHDYKGTYHEIKLADIQNDGLSSFPVMTNRFIKKSSTGYSNIPNSPIAYWATPTMIDLFGKSCIGESFFSGGRNKTHNDEKYLRMIWEVQRKDKWELYAKGGAYRKWYGDIEYLVDWSESARNEYASHGGLVNEKFWNKEGITWTIVTAYKASFRFKQLPVIYSSVSPTIFDNTFSLNEYVLALLNSKVAEAALDAINPTLATNVSDILGLPLIYSHRDAVEKIVSKNINISKIDWDSFETSWDFSIHPLIMFSRNLRDITAIGAAMQCYYSCHPQADSPLELCWLLWKGHANQQFRELKANEEELNRIFIDIYGLQDELTPEVADKDVTVHYLVDTKDDIPASMQGSNYVLTRRDAVVSLISYAVGCMFGRYSLDVEGLAYAGGDWDSVYRMQQEIYTVEGKEVHLADGRVLTVKPTGYNQIKTDDGWKTLSYPVDADNVIPICDDEYFDDDMVGRFVKFIETVYGSDTLEENLKFIADALGGKGTPRDVIRSYFLNDFYADHCKTYQKRPIYWLFDSGKKNGFKALIYMHRYQPDIVARIRTAYVHEQQSRYRTAIADLESRIAAASTAERVKLNKQLKKLQEQDAELRTYEEKIHHLADQMIPIDLDDGVKVNYDKFQAVLAKIK